MHRIGFCLTLVLLSPLCLGEQNLVWVLGSYANVHNAEKERARLSDELGKSVSILETENGLYRVVIDSGSVTSEALSGHEAWLLPVNSNSDTGITQAQPVKEPEAEVAQEAAAEAEFTQKVEPEPEVTLKADPEPTPAPAPEPEPEPEITTKYRVSESDVDDPPLIIEEPPVEPLYPAFRPGESIAQYCTRLPESRLCQHPGIERAIENDRKLMKHRDEIRNACDIVTDPEWRKTCLSLQQ